MDKKTTFIAELRSKITNGKLEQKNINFIGYKNVWMSEVLDLSNTNLSEIPDWFKSFKYLKKLNLKKTLISELPDWINEFTYLEELNISNTRIYKLPYGICQLKFLNKLVVDNITIENVPNDYLLSGAAVVKNYLYNEGSSKAIYELKLVLVGKGGVGKTSLAKKIRNNTFSVNLNEERTTGINIDKWCMITEYKGQKVEFTINIWDFGGQEILHSTHRFFLTRRTVYLYIWDARTDNFDVEFFYWLNMVSILSEDSPIIIVLNKIDEWTKEINQAFWINEFNNIKSYEQISVKNDIGLNKLVNAITREMLNLEHIGQKWPIKWYNVRKELEEDDRDFIECREYLDICEKHNLSKEHALSLSTYLHDLGVILHFQEDMILKDTIFKKTEWVTKAVYKLISDTIIQKNFGEFDIMELYRVWNDYPDNKYTTLLQLLINFEIVFSTDISKKYIIPELLPYSNSTLKFNVENRILFEFRYKFMPNGLLERFICRNYKKFKTREYWKDMVVIEYGNKNTQAIIKRNELEKIITIFITGDERKRYLDIIVNEFAYIHKTFKKLVIDELIACNCQVCNNMVKPEFHNYEDMINFVTHGTYSINCRNSYALVPINQILGNIGYETNKNQKYSGGINMEKVYMLGNDNNIIEGNCNTIITKEHINNKDSDSFEAALKIFLDELEVISQDKMEKNDKEALKEYLEIAKEECSKHNPKKTIIKDTIDKLSFIANSFATLDFVQRNVPILIDFFKKYI